MKVVYKLIDTNIQSDFVDDNYLLQDNETFNKPEDGIYQPFKFIDGNIIGATEEEFRGQIQSSITTEKTDKELVADLAQQLATSQIVQAQTNANLLQQNAKLAKQVLALQAEKETTNG